MPNYRSKLLAGTAAAAALAANAAMAQDTTITVATHYNQEQIAPLQACFDAYEAEHPGVKIEHQQASYRDFLQTILTARVGGTSPDIYNIYSIWAPQLTESRTLAVPPQDIQDFVRGGYSGGSVEAATVNGTLYGIPTELSVYQLLYNKKILAEAGYDAPPKTWDALLEIAAATTQKNGQGNVTVGGYVFGPSVANAVHVFYSQLFSAGAEPFADDNTTAQVNSPEAVKVLESQAKLFADGSTSNSVTVDDFAASGAAMVTMANWQKSALQSAYGDAFEDTVGVAPVPNFTGEGQGTMLYSFLWAVDAQSDVQEESWAFLKWLNSPQADKPISCTGEMLNAMGALSGNMADLAAMDTSDSFTQPYAEAITSGAAQSQPNIWQAAQNDRTLRSYIEQVWAGQMSAQDALDAANAEIQAVLDENY